jgi:hypothetical protein
MTRNEYERRRQQLDEELRAGIQLLESAHRLQVGALDLVWRTWSGEGVQPAAAMEPSAPAGSAGPVPSARGLVEIRNDLPGVLERLPRVFDRRDVCRVLGYEPKRSSLYKALLELVGEGVLALEESGGGQVPSRYRRL